MATTTKNTAVAKNNNENTTKKVTPKKFAANDLISVRSVTPGELLLSGRKSGILYRWSAFGDVTEVEYQDLYSLKGSRSAYVYAPLFVIEDTELLEDPKWKDVVALYESMYNTEDIDQILKLPIGKFKAVLRQVPKGFLNTIKIEVATRIENGTFDSIAKIKAVDELCETDLLCLVK